MSMTPGPKMKASPTPTVNLRTVREKRSLTRPVNIDETEIRAMPIVRALFGPYLAAISPAGSWKSATPRTKVEVTNPRPETF